MKSISEQPPLILPGLTWEKYISLEDFFNQTGTRIKFLEGNLELAPPTSEGHEIRKVHIACLVDYWCLGKEIDFFSKGRRTLVKPDSAGGSPDHSYCLRENKEWPDLVVEIALTSGGLSKRKFYAAFPIPELWIWRNEKLEVHIFDDESNEYVSSDTSTQLPGLDLEWLVECSKIESTREAIVTFRDQI